MDRKTVYVLISLVFVLSGCASSISGSVYPRETARKVQTVTTGKVLYVREVLVEGTKTGIGTAAGGVLGYVLGRGVGSGSGRDIAAVAGTIGGAVAGSAAEEGLTRQKALEITVELSNGSTIAIVQGADEAFKPGDSVRVLQWLDGTARVVQ